MNQSNTYTPSTAMARCPNFECGKEGVSLIDIDGFRYVECSGCYMRGPRDTDPYRAVELWNALSGIEHGLGGSCGEQDSIYSVVKSNMTSCPNPLCGSRNVGIVPTATCAFYYIKCHDCYMHGPHGANSISAIEAWNALSNPDPGWISVSDRLPHPGEYVHAFSQRDGHLVAFRALSTGKWRARLLDGLHWHGHDDDTITHWEYFRSAPDLPEETTTLSESGWISVRDKLPENGTRVWINPKNATGKALTMGITYTDGATWTIISPGSNGYVVKAGKRFSPTHWRPIKVVPFPSDEPEKYKVSDNDVSGPGWTSVEDWLPKKRHSTRWSMRR